MSVVLVDCGARWCANAPFAHALNKEGFAVQVQHAGPDGSTVVLRRDRATLERHFVRVR